ncbi:hypothetical protein [Streptomyces sp. Ac-502]|uniref:hypothetical protein n=1 Tax=Streptomyces sp. Ac-502 TaxID=3342801 RepID=UPI0038626892
MPGSKTVTITVPTGPATSSVSAIQQAINNLSGRTITNYVQTRYIGPQVNGVPLMKQANGGIVTYADGGTRENHVAQIAKGGEWRVWAEDETFGEAYIPFASSKRARSKTILEQVANRFGGTVTYHAAGGLSDWSYQPVGSTGLTVSDVVSKSQRKDKHGDEHFDLGLFERNLHSSVRTAQAWRSDLATVARRAGSEVAKALEEMGEDGIALTRKMARGSGRYINDMAAQLRQLAGAARSSLADYTGQLAGAVKDATAFQNNLARLANSGYGDLATRLAQQGDANAEALAAQAVKDNTKARQANQTAKDATKVLDSDQLTDLVKIISSLAKGRGLHAVAELAGLEEDRLIEVANLSTNQIRGTGKADRFLSDLVKANAGRAYADGGMWTPGIYSSPSPNGLIKFAERSTGGESYIPHAAAKRGRATAVLARTADRFGYDLAPRRLVDAAAGRTQVVIVHQAPAIGSQTIHVRQTSASANDIADVVAYQMRRAKRGGALR